MSAPAKGNLSPHTIPPIFTFSNQFYSFSGAREEKPAGMHVIAQYFIYLRNY